MTKVCLRDRVEERAQIQGVITGEARLDDQIDMGRRGQGSADCWCGAQAVSSTSIGNTRGGSGLGKQLMILFRAG